VTLKGQKGGREIKVSIKGREMCSENWLKRWEKEKRGKVCNHGGGADHHNIDKEKPWGRRSHNLKKEGHGGNRGK